MTTNSDFTPHKVWISKNLPGKIHEIRVKSLIHAAYPHFDNRSIEEQAYGVFDAMEKSGFDVRKERCGRLFVHRSDFIQFYEEAWEDEPELVEAELGAFKQHALMKDHFRFVMKSVKMQRENPFRLVISKQWDDFKRFGRMDCFEEFSNDTLKDVIEFVHGKEMSLCFI